MQGDAIINSGMKEGRFYVLKLQKEYLETCNKYDHGFASFTECARFWDQQMSVTELGCIVPWMSSKNQCRVS